MQRARCFKCGGKGLCTHGRQRNRCSECGGKGLCKHARRKEDCKECSTKLFCVHRRRSYSCVDCGGAGTCEHKVIRSTCRQCGGGSMCKHGKRRCRCNQCKVPAGKQQTPKRSHSHRSNAIVSLEQCLFKDVSVMHLTSADLHVVTRAVKSAEPANLTDAGRTFRQCVFTPHNKSPTTLTLSCSSVQAQAYQDHYLSSLSRRYKRENTLETSEERECLSSIACAWLFNKTMNTS